MAPYPYLEFASMTMTDAPDVIAETFGPGETDDEASSAAVPAPFRFPDFEGLDVIGARIEVRNVAGGLNDAMDVAPVILHSGDEFDVTYRCKVGPIRHDPVDKKEPDGEQYRVHIAYASRAVIVPPEVTASQFERQAAQLAEREQIKGQQKLEVGEEQTSNDDPGEPAPPFLGFEELTTGEVVARIEGAGDDDQDLVDAIEAWEEANVGRAEILNAVKVWRDQGE